MESTRHTNLLVGAMLLATLMSSSAEALELRWKGGMQDIAVQGSARCTLEVLADGTPPSEWRLLWLAGRSGLGVGTTYDANTTARPCAIEESDEMHTFRFCSTQIPAGPTNIFSYYFDVTAEPARIVLAFGGMNSADSIKDVTVNGGANLSEPLLIRRMAVSPDGMTNDIVLEGPRLGNATAAYLQNASVTVACEVIPEAEERIRCIPSGVLASGTWRITVVDTSGWQDGIAVHIPAPSGTSSGLIVRFREGAVTRQNLPDGSPHGVPASSELAVRLSSLGIDSLTALLPWRTAHDLAASNSAGEPVQLSDLSTVYVTNELPPTPGGRLVADTLRTWPEVVYAGVDDTSFVTFDIIPNDELFSSQWGLYNPGGYICGFPLMGGADISATWAWTYPPKGTGVRIGIIDSGVLDFHEDMFGRVTGEDFTGEDCWSCDARRHGTAVASLAAATAGNQLGIAGVAWDADLVSLRVLGSQFVNEATTTSRIVAALDWARASGIPIVNMSVGSRVGTALGQTSIDLLGDALKDAVMSGMTVVAASGNAPRGPLVYEYSESWPAWFWQKVITVGAMLPNGVRWTDDVIDANFCASYQLNCFASNYEPSLPDPIVDVVAPGGAFVVAADGWGNHDYMTNSGCIGADFGGTSAAAPIVSGIAALLKEYDSGLEGRDIEEIVERTAEDMLPAGYDAATGSGRADAQAALGYVMRPRRVVRGQVTSTPNEHGALALYQSGQVSRTFVGVEALKPHIPDGNWSGTCTRYTYRGTLTWSFDDVPGTWLRPSSTTGWRNSGAYFGNQEVGGGQLVPGSLSSTGAQFEMVLYLVPVAGGVWVPAPPAMAAMSFTAVGLPSGWTLSAPEISADRNAVIVTPNPSRNGPKVQFTYDDAGVMDWELVDLQGRRVHSGRAVGAPGTPGSIALSDAERRIGDGVYWLVWRSRSGSGARRVIVFQ